jgi:hypothetical protein
MTTNGKAKMIITVRSSVGQGSKNKIRIKPRFHDECPDPQDKIGRG